MNDLTGIVVGSSIHANRPKIERRANASLRTEDPIVAMEMVG